MTFYSQVCQRHSRITKEAEQIVPLLLLALHLLFKPQNSLLVSHVKGQEVMRFAFLVSQVWLSGRQTHPEALVLFVWFYVFFTVYMSGLKSFCLQIKYFCWWLQTLSAPSSFNARLWQNIKSLFESCSFGLSHCRRMSSFSLCPYSVIMDAMQ